MKACGKRYEKVAKGEKVYCIDGTAHLVDQASISVADNYHECVLAFQ